MTSPVSRPPLSTAHLAVLQARPVAPPVKITAPAPQQRQELQPAAQSPMTALRRGSLINIVA